MKANELMVGDWVYAIDANGEKHPCRANNLEYDYTNKLGDFCVDFYGTGYEAEWPDVAFNVEPIPLTPEILKKNGFNARGYEELVLDADEHCFALQKGVDGINAWWWELFSSPIIPINHVHELQHALRFCGIEKEIEL